MSIILFITILILIISAVCGYFLAQPKNAPKQNRFFLGLMIYLIILVAALLPFYSSFGYSLMSLETHDAIVGIVLLTLASSITILSVGRLVPPYRPILWQPFFKALGLWLAASYLSFMLFLSLIARGA